MSVSTRILAVSAALLLLAGCRHKPKPSRIAVSQAAAPASNAPATPLPAALAPLLKQLPQALDQIHLQAMARGLAGWPGLRGENDEDLPSPPLENLAFRNDRVLLFRTPKSLTFTALALMKKAQPPSEDAYSLVVIRGFPNSPVLDASTAEGRTGTGTDALIWSDRESTHVSDFADLNTWPVPGFRILPDKPTDFAIATEGTDNFGWNVYAPDKPIAMFIDDLTNDQDQAENKEDQATEGYGNFLRRSIFAKGHKVGEAGPYIWFESEGTTYATDKTDWDLWMKGAHSSSTTKP